MTVVGVTTRITMDPDHGEVRDSLAHDWIVYLNRVAPDIDPLPVPNQLLAPVDWAERFGIGALLLTGGEDIADSPRDTTEVALLKHARSVGLPIFAVCRGLQLLQTEAGGSLELVEGHVATTTAIRHVGPWRPRPPTSVPCYHHLGIAPDSLASGLTATAVDDRGWVEAAVGDHREVGVMWHPERRAAIDPADAALVRQALGLDKDLA